MASLRQWTRRLSRAISKHGVHGTVQLAPGMIFRQAAQWNTIDARRQRQRHRLEREYDRRYGVNTGGSIFSQALAIQSESRKYGRHYSAARREIFEAGVRALGIAPARFTFVDFGSGKGKALLLAAQHGFKRIVGVEYCEELHRVAEENIRRYRRKTGQNLDMTSLWMDAAEFPIPDEPLVCFLYNPFGAEIVARVLDNLRRSLEAAPRDLYILYLSPWEIRLLREADFLVEIASRDGYAAFRAREPC